MVELSPKGSHQSNGAAESQVRRLEDLVRALVHAVERRLGVRIMPTSIILPWLVRHAAFLLTRYQLKEDGRSAWARLRG
eukprot:8524233-Lingulodinium_polyedra.AAC.1